MADIKLNFWGNVHVERMFDIHDNEKVVVYNGSDCPNKGGQDGDSTCAGAPAKKGGAKPKRLFANEEDMHRECKRFLDYLSRHNMRTRQLASDKGNVLNDIVTCFLKVWGDRNLLVDNYSGAAVFRFLKEDCGMTSSVTEKTYRNMIKERIKSKDYDVKTLCCVMNSFKNNSF